MSGGKSKRRGRPDEPLTESLADALEGEEPSPSSPSPTVGDGRRVVYYDSLFCGGEPVGLVGFVLKDIRLLPRGDEVEEEAYLLARLQAMEEGFATSHKAAVDTVELELRARGMLNSEQKRDRKRLDTMEKTVNSLLNWNTDRHTLAGNSTSQRAGNVRAGKKD